MGFIFLIGRVEKDTRPQKPGESGYSPEEMRHCLILRTLS